MKKIALMIFLVLSEMLALAMPDVSLARTIRVNNPQYVEFYVSSASPTNSIDLGYVTEGTCNISGTFTAQLDIEGSVDNTNWDDLAPNITTTGNVSFVNKPFIFLRVNPDTYTSGTAIIKCIVGR